MKTSPENVTVLLVGGGSIIAPEILLGVGEIVRPPFFSVANAVGAAMAKGECRVCRVFVPMLIHSSQWLVKWIRLRSYKAVILTMSSIKLRSRPFSEPYNLVLEQVSRLV